MSLTLNSTEIRAIGCLIEKEHTTPDYYPLTLKALTTACNQKSNREPVLDLSESEVQNAIDNLKQHTLIRERSGERVPRFAHLLHRSFELSEQELALLCVLFVRGPQTPGELRTRTGRIAEFADSEAAEQVLEQLAAREDGPISGGHGFVVKLPRQTGRRECRYMHLFSGEVDLEAYAQEAASTSSSSAGSARAELEIRVTALETRLAELERQLGLDSVEEQSPSEQQ